MKTFALVILVLSFLYDLFLTFLDIRSADHPVPTNVQDVYNRDEYIRWRAYNTKKNRVWAVHIVAEFVLTFLLFCTDAYAWASRLFGNGVYAAALAVTLFSLLASLLVDLPTSYYDDMVIEQEYGFNRKTKKLFWQDQGKEFVIGFLFNFGLVCLFAALYRAMGDGVLILFSAAAFLVMLLITFLYPVLSRIFNKFTPLEEGSLKERLTSLMESHGYKVRAIQVMDASKRSTKSNAYFAGFGKMKTIVLYDTLLSQFTEDEIVAVFAHEVGHGLHKDTLKNQLLSLLNVAVMAVLFWLNVRTESLYVSFGFEEANFGFAFILLAAVEMALLSPLLSLLQSAVSRKAEYRADRQAVTEGAGEALISALKKLARENFANLSPSPWVVKLTYSHPTVSQRITAIEEAIRNS